MEITTIWEVVHMILTGLVISGLVLAAFLILVVGIRSTERHHGLRNPQGDGPTGVFARWVLGVYADRPRHENEPAEYGCTRR